MARRKRNDRNQRVKPRRKFVQADLYEIVKLLLVISVSVVVLYGMNVAKKVPVETVEIRSSLQHVNPKAIKERVAAYIDAGFFQAQINRLESDIEEISWVYQAHVKRAWPDRLIISIQEQEPIFRWGDGALLNKYGEQFQVGDVSQYLQLPELSGTSGREIYLARLFSHYQPLFKQHKLRLLGIHEDQRHNKIFTFSSGVKIVVGSGQAEQRLDRYLRALEKMPEEKQAKIVSVDLRHANGFAIQWNS